MFVKLKFIQDFKGFNFKLFKMSIDITCSLVVMSDDELVEAVEKLRREETILETENSIIENFLRKMDPKLLIGVKTILAQASRIQGQLEQAEGFRISRSRSAISCSSFSSISSSQSYEQAKRINIPTKLELLGKEKESEMKFMDNYYRKTKKRKQNVKAELEEINTQLIEVQESREMFEKLIVRDSVDLITQRIPAEKFFRYMEDWLKCADSAIEKFRLKIATLYYRRQYLQHQLNVKEELGETVQLVDFEQLKIDHRVLAEKIETKNLDLLDLKKKTGQVNLILSKTRKLLLDRLKILNKLKIDIEHKRLKVRELNTESEAVQKDVIISEKQLKKLQQLDDKFTVPELNNYIRQKAETYQIKKVSKMWRRRNFLQQSDLKTCITTMKRLTKSNTVNPDWFNPPPPAKLEKSQSEIIENED